MTRFERFRVEVQGQMARVQEFTHPTRRQAGARLEARLQLRACDLQLRLLQIQLQAAEGA